MSNLLDAVELMNDFNIRYVPVVEGVELLGVVDTLSLMEALLNYTDKSTFEDPVTNIINDDFFRVKESDSVLDVIRKVAKNQPRAAFMMDGYIFQGMFTDVDILSNDYLWTEMDDFTLNSETEVGLGISEFTCVSADASIQQALQLMLHLKSEIVGLIDDSSKVLVGTLGIMDIVEYLVHHIKDKGVPPDKLFRAPLNTIFPRSGLYVREPIALSELRRMMLDNDSYLAILLNDVGYPTRMISVHDLILEYVSHSRFILEVDES